MNDNKISHAAELCLDHAINTDRPFFHVKTYIDRLKGDPTWTAEEVAEVQMDVIRALMQRDGSTPVGGERSAPDNDPSTL